MPEKGRNRGKRATKAREITEKSRERRGRNGNGDRRKEQQRQQNNQIKLRKRLPIKLEENERLVKVLSTQKASNN